MERTEAGGADEEVREDSEDEVAEADVVHQEVVGEVVVSVGEVIGEAEVVAEALAQARIVAQQEAEELLEDADEHLRVMVLDVMWGMCMTSVAIRRSWRSSITICSGDAQSISSRPPCRTPDLPLIEYRSAAVWTATRWKKNQTNCRRRHLALIYIVWAMLLRASTLRLGIHFQYTALANDTRPVVQRWRPHKRVKPPIVRHQPASELLPLRLCV